MLRWEREDGRFYAAFICKDLLGDWTVVKSWGGKGRPGTKIATIRCEDKQEAIDLLVAIARRRLQRGYKLVDIVSLYGEVGYIESLKCANDD